MKKLVAFLVNMVAIVGMVSSYLLATTETKILCNIIGIAFFAIWIYTVSYIISKQNKGRKRRRR